MWQHALPPAWQELLGQQPPGLAEAERQLQGQPCQPGPERMFRALELVAPAAARVVILGQDPYPRAGLPTGLAFDVGEARPWPPSLRNILAEYSDDLGHPLPVSGDLSPWCEQGVLLLNTALTVAPGSAGSQTRIWAPFARGLLQGLLRHRQGLVLVAWGRPAQALFAQLPTDGHALLASNHPSPLSARRPPRPFVGSRPFSAVNRLLAEQGQAPVDWRLP